jgi:hypothetical protein
MVLMAGMGSRYRSSCGEGQVQSVLARCAALLGARRCLSCLPGCGCPSRPQGAVVLRLLRGSRLDCWRVGLQDGGLLMWAGAPKLQSSKAPKLMWAASLQSALDCGGLFCRRRRRRPILGWLPAAAVVHQIYSILLGRPSGPFCSVLGCHGLMYRLGGGGACCLLRPNGNRQAGGVRAAGRGARGCGQAVISRRQ